jgi:hypothetical protein
MRRRRQVRLNLAAKGFLPVDEYMRLKGVPVKSDKLTPESDLGNNAQHGNTVEAVREESEEDSDEAMAMDIDACAYNSVNGACEEESEEDLPGSLHNIQHQLTHHTRIESEESSGDDDGNGVGNYARRHISGDETEIFEDEETHTASECLEGPQYGTVLVHQNISEGVPGSTFQILHDHPKLQRAGTQLTKVVKQDDLDVIIRARVTAMIGLLNIYMDKKLGYSWRRASEIVARTQGRGTNRARRIREWVMDFLRWRDLPLHQLNRKRGTILDDEDVAQVIRSRMVEIARGGFLKAEDVMEIVASPHMQGIFAQKGISKSSISIKTALRWLDKLGWSYGNLKHGMYLDGHERSDVVEYRQAFVERWMGHERRFHRWDHNGIELPRPIGFAVPGVIGRFRLILVTHDESTFFQNDERNTGWSHTTSKSKPKAKGNGQTLMVSDFLTPDWGRLRDGNKCVPSYLLTYLSKSSHTFTTIREARIIFKVGKNRDGFFDADNLLTQVNNAIDIFEGLTRGEAQGLFLFDNAPSHQKRARDAISARNMVKGASIIRIVAVQLTSLTGPKAGWTRYPNGPRMRSGTLPNGEPQPFYFPEDHPSMPGWFKGMEIIIWERGQWPEGVANLLAQCQGFHCPPGCTHQDFGNFLKLLKVALSCLSCLK